MEGEEAEGGAEEQVTGQSGTRLEECGGRSELVGMVREMDMTDVKEGR